MKTKVICKVCKGDGVTLDALVYWDDDIQNWVVFDVAEPRGFCRDCIEDTDWDMVDIETGGSVFHDWQVFKLMEAE